MYFENLGVSYLVMLSLIIRNSRFFFKYRILVKVTPKMREGETDGGSNLMKVKKC